MLPGLETCSMLTGNAQAHTMVLTGARTVVVLGWNPAPSAVEVARVVRWLPNGVALKLAQYVQGVLGCTAAFAVSNVVHDSGYNVWAMANMIESRTFRGPVA